ncbi:MAG: type II toxin-antitoxin system Phd/YefM family antitoxin [Desulfobacterales bacterium]|nr:type II toxin-antitoxin system Phd/YefM family antitoxin [Desulfobacterales bacterium]
MQTLTIGELKTSFSEVLKKIRSGQKIVISYGRKREKVAVIVPYSAYGLGQK